MERPLSSSISSSTSDGTIATMAMKDVKDDNQLEKLLIDVSRSMNKCLQGMWEWEKEDDTCDDAIPAVCIEWILKTKWVLIMLNRLERLLTGELLDAKPNVEWMSIPVEIRQLFGAFSTKSAEYARMESNFEKTQLDIMENMMKHENTILGVMLLSTQYPSGDRCAEMAAKVRDSRIKLERAFKDFLEAAKNENPRTVSGSTIATSRVSHDSILKV